jgi:hypothetical protein
LNKGFKLGGIVLSGCAVVAQPFLYREPGVPVSTLLNGKAVLTEPVLCQGFHQ